MMIERPSASARRPPVTDLTIAVPPADLPVILWPFDPKLARLLPAGYAQRQQIVPLALDDESLVVGAGQPITEALVTDIAQFARRPVSVIPISRDELTVLSARLYGSGRETFGALGASFDPDELGMAFRLPRIRLAGRVLAPPICWLIPSVVAERLRVAIVDVIAGTIIIATDRPPTTELIAEIVALTGYEPRICLAESAEIDAYLSQVYRDHLASDPADWIQTAERLGLVSKTDLDRARAVAHEREEPIESVIQRLGLIESDERLSAIGLARDLPICHPANDLRRDRTGGILPLTLMQRLGAIVLDIRESHVDLALADSSDPTTGEIVSALARQPVSVRLADLAEIEATIATLSDRDDPKPATPLAIAKRLAENALPGAPNSRAAARRHYDDRTLVGALISEGILPETAVESAAIAQQLPWADLALAAPDPDALAALPQAIAQRQRILPLRLDGGLLVAAVANPQDEAAAQAVHEQTGRALAPVLVDPGRIDAVIGLRYDRPQTGLDREVERFLDSLLFSGVLTAQSAAATRRYLTIDGDPLDIALGRVGAADIPALLSKGSGAPFARLGHAEHAEPVVDALGRTESRQTYRDPVVHEIACLIDAETALRKAILPFAAWDERIAIAVADPFDQRTIEAVVERLDRAATLVVAPRSDIEAAVRRHLVQRSLGDALLESGIIDSAQLTTALDLHQRTGVRLGKALISLGFVTGAQLSRSLAEQHGLAYYELGETPVDPEVVRLIPSAFARERGLLPLANEDGTLLLAMSDPLDSDAIEQVEFMTGLGVRPVLVVDDEIDRGLESVYRLENLEHSARDLLFRYPEESASRVLSRGQKVFFIGFLLVSAVALIVAPIPFLTLLVSLATIFYVTFSVYKFYLVFRSMTHGSAEIRVTREEALAIPDRDLPVYTILVPMYKEPEVLPILLAACARLEYPKSKLDVKLLLEEDDPETVEAARRANLPPHFDIIVVPDGKPKGKPKACNYGLLHSRGEYVVIYDAEDIPEPDQLRKAIVAFQKASDAVTCIQARLNYFNRDQNILTRWFTTEYSGWFDLFLPGLDATNSPIPLGGTSNHFRADRLRELGGWDPYNVTEDADLGMRLFKMGWKTAVLESTTYEEANSELGNWIRQRSRWVKGYIQTYLVQMRHPIKLWQQIGPYPFFSFQMVIGGTFLGFLLNPIFWALTLLWILTKASFIQEIFPTPIFYLGAFGLYIGNFAFLYINVAGCLQRRYYGLVKYALLSPLYWALMSIAAWKALYQLFTKPFYWEKTRHGLYKGQISVETIGQPSGSSRPQ